ncbi:radical SAM protein [Candidatus Woesearchaeota archaeon]|nr:radical SAM protein [Candidatus Woesearchaeota archaeon]
MKQRFIKDREIRLLLINAPHRDLYGPIKLAAGKYFPMGIGYIASYCISKGHKVKLLDPEPQHMQHKDIKKAIRLIKPDIIGITSATPNFNNAVEVAKIAKRVSDAIIVMGGVHVSSFPEQSLMVAKEIDIVAIGEGEEIMNDICQYVKGQIRKLKEIRGIVYRGKEGKIFNTGFRPPIENMDKLPFPAYHLTDFNLYKPNVYKSKGTRTATIISSRGCPSFCIYCASHKVHGRRYRAHSAEYIIKLVEYLIKKYNINHIGFEDDTFTFDVKRAKKICELMIEKGLNRKLKWSCYSKVTSITEDLLRIMKKAGCYTVNFGIESGDQKILKIMKKGTTVKLNKQAIELSNKLGLRTQANFLFGAPGETKETIENTIKFALDTNPTMAFFNVICPYPGTELFDQCFSGDAVDKIKDWQNFVGIGVNPPLPHSNLTQGELKKAIASAYRRFYFRPKAIWNILRSLSSFHEFKELTLGAFGLILQIEAWTK